MADLVEAIQKVAQTTQEQGKPTAVLFGTVISAKPLKISVEQKLVLGPEQLILTRNVTDYEMEISKTWSGRSSAITVPGWDVSVASGGNPAHSHGAEATLPSNVMIVHNALEDGEKVLLIRQAGGQKFIVIDRVVSE